MDVYGSATGYGPKFGPYLSFSDEDAKNLFTVHFSCLKYQDASLRHDSCTEDKRSVDAFFHTALLPLFDTCGDTGTEVLLQLPEEPCEGLEITFRLNEGHGYR